MYKIGIIGGSFAQGKQEINDTAKFTKPFEWHLKKAMPNYEFINLSSSGTGSERYLSCILELHNNHNIDLLLLDIQTDKSNTQYPRGEKYMHNKDYKDYIYNHTKYSTFLRTKCDSSVLVDVPDNKIKIWKDVGYFIDYESKFHEYKGNLNIIQSVELCNVLNLPYAIWGTSVWDNTYNYYPMHDYIKDNNLQTCDGHHPDDAAMEHMAQNYFKDLINENINSRR